LSEISQIKIDRHTVPSFVYTDASPTKGPASEASESLRWNKTLRACYVFLFDASPTKGPASEASESLRWNKTLCACYVFLFDASPTALTRGTRVNLPCELQPLCLPFTGI
jgi:hypothetical protein